MGPIKPVNHTSWVTLADVPKSVISIYVIEHFGCVCVLSVCFCEFCAGTRTFVIGLVQIYFIFSLRLQIFFNCLTENGLKFSNSRCEKSTFETFHVLQNNLLLTSNLIKMFSAVTSNHVPHSTSSELFNYYLNISTEYTKNLRIANSSILILEFIVTFIT